MARRGSCRIWYLLKWDISMEDSPEILLSPLSPYTYLSTANYQSTFGYIFWAKNEQMLAQWTVPCCCQLVPTKPGTCLLGTISFTVVHLGTTACEFLALPCNLINLAKHYEAISLQIALVIFLDELSALVCRDVLFWTL
ncbi:hypothetical protein BDE02_01G110100 [Populus trichocarpa]|nr:hypothetical protein BDE02_01G110100 [Populus trichocarpa]